MVLLAGATVAGAEDQPAANSDFDTSGQYAGSYLCIPVASSGVTYNEQSKKWDSTRFDVSSRKYVLKITAGQMVKAPTYKQVDVPDGKGGTTKDFQNVMDDAMRYDVSITEFGQSAPSPCWERGPTKNVVINNNYGLQCAVIGGEFHLVFQTMRYMSTYLVGYVGGQDNNDNTPYLQIGTCEKIQ